MCKIRSGSTELSTPVNVTVEVSEEKVDRRYYIDGKAEMTGFTFVVMLVLVLLLCNTTFRKCPSIITRTV